MKLTPFVEITRPLWLNAAFSLGLFFLLMRTPFAEFLGPEGVLGVSLLSAFFLSVIFLPLKKISRFFLMLELLFQKKKTPYHSPDFFQTNLWEQWESKLKHLLRDIEQQASKIHQVDFRLQALLNSLQDPVVILDHHQNCLSYNSRFKVVFPEKTRPYNGVLKFRHLFPEGELQDQVEEWQQAVQQQLGPLDPSVFHSVIFFHEQHFYQTSFNILADQSPLLLLIFHDITATKLSEEKQKDFVANISHEMRTPLTAMKGFAQLLQRELKNNPSTTESMQMALNRIISNTNRLTDFFHDLLELVKTQNQRDTLSLGDVKMDEIWQDLIPLFATEIEQKSIQLKLPHSYNNLSVITHRRTLERVFQNLLENALKYSPIHGRITLDYEDQGSNHRFTLADEGPGIPPEHQTRVFERFYRVDSGRDRNKGGTGLGLALVKAMVNELEGQIFIDPDYHLGTKMVLEFPKKD